jgi:hypothetical protein|tara:strand:- start:2 stop:163 length:162 start_codon:yes stop_codon:yes gene_type:complete
MAANQTRDGRKSAFQMMALSSRKLSQKMVERRLQAAYQRPLAGCQLFIFNLLY